MKSCNSTYTNNVSQALNKSKTSADNYLKNILECTWGIAFLGTPHSGSDQAGWAGIATKMIGLVKQTNKDIIEPLKRNSYELERIEGDFQTMIRARHNEKKRVLHIVSFYETNPIPGIGPVSTFSYKCLFPLYVLTAKSVLKASSCVDYGMKLNRLPINSILRFK